MTVIALNQQLASISGRVSAAYVRAREQMPSQEVVLVGALLIIAQILDGVFTSIGVGHFGLHVEGNALLRALMYQIGYVPALVIVKTFACAAVCVLCALAPRVTWLPRAMVGMLALYLVAAIIPWSYVILTKII